MKKDLLIYKSYLIESRKQLMDVIEVAFIGRSGWPIMRSKLLDFFGNNGLEGEINRLIKKYDNEPRSKKLGR